VEQYPSTIKLDLKAGWDGVDWIYMALNKDKFLAVLKTVMNLRVILKKNRDSGPTLHGP